MTKFETLIERFKVELQTWLVTGNAGFIGSNLTAFLLKHGQKVIGLDNFSTGYQHNIDDVIASVGKVAAKNFTFIESDIAKAQNFLGYVPTHNIYQGIKEPVEWYIEYLGEKTLLHV